jgi:hypothetical protein
MVAIRTSKRNLKQRQFGGAQFHVLEDELHLVGRVWSGADRRQAEVKIGEEQWLTSCRRRETQV